MIRHEDGRSVIHCDRCPVRLDLGPAGLVQARLRMPSGWVQDEPQHHLCPLCTRKDLASLGATDQPSPG